MSAAIMKDAVKNLSTGILLTKNYSVIFSVCICWGEKKDTWCQVVWYMYYKIHVQMYGVFKWNVILYSGKISSCIHKLLAG